MSTATEQMLIPPRRRQRAMALTAAVMRAIGPHIDRGHPLQHISRAIMDLFMTAGVEVITDEDRNRAGLPPRNEYGMTDQEMVALEQMRMELMLRPMPPIILSNSIK